MPGDDDVVFDLECCGVCHSDLHMIQNDLGNSVFPMIPGHELAGTVTSVGKNVTKFNVGDSIGVGCFVDSCRDCAACKCGDEQYCGKGMTLTYNSPRAHGRAGPLEDTPTKGGYSSKYVVNENYGIKVPKSYPLEKAGPVMCSAITLWDPLMHFGAGKGGKKVGIAGIGGLGVMGIKLALALGNEVYGITNSPGKKAKIEEFGAKCVVASDPEAMKAMAGTFDLILDTVSAKHDLMTYIPLLAHDGTHVLLGLVTEPFSFVSLPMIFQRTKVAGSVIAGIKSTQDCMDFCAEKNIYQETQLVPCDKVNWVLEKLKSVNDTPVRYVLDIKNTMPKFSEVEGDVAQS